MDPRELQGVRKIAVIWIGRLGDFLITIPFLDSLRRRFPAAKIAAVTSERGREAAELCAAVDEIIALGGPGPGLGGLVGNARAASRLVSERFDLLIDLNSAFSKTSVALSWLASSRVKLAFHRTRGNFAFTHTEASSDELHMLDRYKRLAGALGAPYDPDRAVTLRLKKAEEAAGREAVRRAAAGAPPGSAIVLIHPGNFKKFENRWPQERFVALSERLLSSGGATPIYLAGPGEEAAVRAIAGRISSAPAVVGPLSLGASAGAIKEADLLVVNATGTAHLGWLVGAPTFTFLSGYTAKIWMQPPGPRHHHVLSASWESCRDIPVEAAWEALEPFLASLPRRAKTAL